MTGIPPPVLDKIESITEQFHSRGSLSQRQVETLEKIHERHCQ